MIIALIPLWNLFSPTTDRLVRRGERSLGMRGCIGGRRGFAPMAEVPILPLEANERPQLILLHGVFSVGGALGYNLRIFVSLFCAAWGEGFRPKTWRDYFGAVLRVGPSLGSVFWIE